MKLSAFIFLLMTLPITSQAVKVVGNGRIPNYNYYKNSLFNYVLMYPQQWTLSEQGKITSFTNISSVSDVNKASSVQIEGIDKIVDTMSSERDNLQKLYRYIHLKYSSIPWQQATYNNMNGFRYSYASKTETQEYFYLIWGNHVLAITNIKRDFQDGIEGVNSILSSLNEQLYAAACSGNLNEVRNALIGGANPNYLSNDGTQGSPLMCSSYRGFNEIVCALLAYGANPNLVSPSDNATALMRAIANHQDQTAKILIAAGASVNMQDKIGYSVLMWCFGAPNHGRLVIAETVKLLIASGADVNLRNTYGESALWLASEGGRVNGADNVESVMMLINAGAQLDIQNIDGETALMTAVLGSPGVVRLLIYAKANLNLRDHKGRTALGIAKQYNYNDTAKLIQDAGGIE